MSTFVSDLSVATTGWAAFERLVARLLVADGYEYVSGVGITGDGGADVLGIANGKRWLFQVKRLGAAVTPTVLDRTVAAARAYGADIPAVVSKSGFTAEARSHRALLARQGVNIQLWDREFLARKAMRLAPEPPILRRPSFSLRAYQEEAVQRLVANWQADRSASALIVLATGLGKTAVAAEALRRLSLLKPGLRCLVLAHTNDLVYQLERSWWPFLDRGQLTSVVAGAERPLAAHLSQFDFVFATRDSLLSLVTSGQDPGSYDVVVVDECHHLGAAAYEELLDVLGVGVSGGPYLIGLTATPWRPDGGDLSHRFDRPVVSIDLVAGLRAGCLANVDYRIFTDNIDWDALRLLNGDRFTPRAINRTMFISEWDDGVVRRVAEAWAELEGRGRGIVFCGTVEHAEKMAERINLLGFAHARPIYSESSRGIAMPVAERNRLLWDFADGRIGILCAVDVLNEGVDVPDVNLVVFQRVTHSRRIFVQQLGRGLRLAPGKAKVLVLDFVTDVRRFAAGLDLQRALDDFGPAPGRPAHVRLPSAVTFHRANSPDVSGAAFLREWLGDVQECEDAGEDVSVLRFPPVERLPNPRVPPE